MRRKLAKIPVRGYKCVNRLMTKVIGRVLTKAKQRNEIAKKRTAEPEKYRDRNQKAQAKFYREHEDKVLKWNAEQRAAKYDRFLERTREQRKLRRLTDHEYVIKDRLRARLSSALRRKKAGKPTNTFNLVGCSANELFKRFTLLPGEEIDHIFPFELYDLTSEADLRKVMHYTNMQSLTEEENGDKSARLPTKAMAAKVARWAWPDGVTEADLPDRYDGWSTALRK